MRKNVLIATLLLVSSALGTSVQAEAPRQSFSTRTCGAYRYDIDRLVDGFLIRVAQGAQVRSVFYRDAFSPSHAVSQGNYSRIVSECQGNALAFVDYYSSKYDRTKVIRLLDPASMRTTGLGSRSEISYNGSEVTFSPPEAQTHIEQILAQPQDEWSITKTELVSKRRIAAEKSDILNDKSFFVFDGKGGIVRKTADSSWNTTEAVDSLVCENDVAYVLYAKKFSANYSPTSSFPPIQYVIERSGDGARKLIPVPSVNGSWKNMGEGIPFLSGHFGDCSGKNASFFMETRVTIVSSGTPFVNWFDPKASIEPTYKDGGYYAPGRLWRTKDGIIGDAAIKTLNADGSVIVRQPAYFRDLMQYPVGTSMEFLKDPRDPQKTLIRLRTPSYAETYHIENSGSYQEIDGKNLNWTHAWSSSPQVTPLYVAADKNNLVVKSFFLEKAMLLHGLPHGNYALVWQRIGPLERDGSRKIWYAFKIDGETQTWFAVVR